MCSRAGSLDQEWIKQVVSTSLEGAGDTLTWVLANSITAVVYVGIFYFVPRGILSSKYYTII